MIQNACENYDFSKLLSGGDTLRSNLDESGAGEFKLEYKNGGYRLGRVLNWQCVFYETYNSNGEKIHANCVVEPRPDGQSLLKWEDGSFMLCKLEDMRPQGAYVHYYPDGSRQEGVHVDGVRDKSRQVFFDKTGKKITRRRL